MAEESPATCLYCDVETQQGLASRLLHTLAVRATLRKMTVEEAVVQLREKLLPPPTPSKKAPGPSLQTLHLAIQAAEDVKAKGLSFFNTKAENDMRVAAAEKDMDVTFRHPEREKLAAELIRAYDTEREYHCGACVSRGSEAADVCSEAANVCSEADVSSDAELMERHRLSCIFRPLSCRNEGCVSIHSAKAELRHDSVCGFKLISCPLGCPEVVQRQHMHAHVDGPCDNKPVDCPFAIIGCKVPCTQGSLQAHLDDACSAHLSTSRHAINVAARHKPNAATVATDP